MFFKVFFQIMFLLNNWKLTLITFCCYAYVDFFQCLIFNDWLAIGNSNNLIGVFCVYIFIQSTYLIRQKLRTITVIAWKKFNFTWNWRKNWRKISELSFLLHKFARILLISAYGPKLKYFREVFLWSREANFQNWIFLLR